MKVGHQYKYILEHGGINQAERYAPMLDADYFKIDDRSTSDLINYVLEFADNLVFFNKDNKPDGTFRTVFEGDDTIDLIKLSSYNVEALKDQFNFVHTEFRKTKNRDMLVQYFLNGFYQIQYWMNAFGNTAELNKEIQQLANHNIPGIFAAFYNHFKAKSELLQKSIDIIPKYWLNASPISVGKKNDAAFSKRLFGIVITLVYEMVNLGKSYLEFQLNKYQEVNPQVALLLAYIDLYKLAQQELNQQNSRHLKHYYEDILFFKPKGIIPDKVYLFPELAPNKQKAVIPENTWFNAGNDDDGNELKYITEKEFVVSHVKAEKNLLVCRDNYKPISFSKQVMDVYHIPLQLNKPGQSKGYSNTLGWVISHSALKLEEGVRKISFNFCLERYSALILKRQLKSLNSEHNSYKQFLEKAIAVSFSNETGWVKVGFENIETSFIQDSNGIYILVIQVLLNDTDQAVAEFGLHENANEFGSDMPLFRFTFNKNNASACNLFFDLYFSNLYIDIDVLGVKNLKLQNDYGIIDQNAPFMPFGPTPNIGAGFYIGHQTLLTHPLKELFVNINWFNTPDTDGGFPEYYKGYSYVNSNNIFKARLLYLSDKTWKPDADAQMVELFEVIEFEEDPNLQPINDFRGIDNISLDELAHAKNDSKGFNVDRSKARSGWMKMELCYPPTGFGHKEYNDLVKKSISNTSKKNATVIPENEPWVPQMKSITVDYSTTVEVSFQKNDNVADGELYHILPFGLHKVQMQRKKQFQLLPLIKEGGAMFIGLKNVNPPQIFNVFFRVSDFISDYLPTDETFNWSVLNGTKWEILEQNQLLQDDTKGFIQSGAIQFDLNKTLNASPRGILPEGYTWLKLEARTDIRFFSHILDIKSEVITATYDVGSNKALTGSIASNTITATGNYVAGVTAIDQPYASFGGKSAENYKQFITRASERLRHKNRMITIWDYEHLVLEKFNAINRVKCLPNTDINFNVKPGNVLSVFVPFVHKVESGSHIPALPRNYLERIKRFIQSKSSPFANIEVSNPIYEEVQLKFNVRFKKELNYRYYAEKLQNELIKLFSPWQFDSDSELSFGVELKAASIIYFLERRPYVDVITNLELLQIVGKKTILHDLSKEGNMSISPTTPISIFISAERHIINIAHDDIEDVEGIEDMSLGNDFIVTAADRIFEDAKDGIEKLTLGVDLRILDDEEEEKDNTNCYIILKK